MHGISELRNRNSTKTINVCQVEKNLFIFITVKTSVDRSEKRRGALKDLTQLTTCRQDQSHSCQLLVDDEFLVK